MPGPAVRPAADSSAPGGAPGVLAPPPSTPAGDAPPHRAALGTSNVQRFARLADVASAAGVSTATASRALSGRGRVSVETRARVRDAAVRLDFQPSELGRQLRTRATHTIGFVVPNVGSWFYANALKGAQHRLEAAGYQVLLMDTDERPERELAALRTLLDGRVDGIVLCSAGPDETAVQGLLRRHQLPLICFDNVLASVGDGRVTLGNERGLRLLVDHLAVEHGHRRIGYVGGIVSETSGAERLAGFRLGVLANGLAYSDAFVRGGAWTAATGSAGTRELLDLPDPPTAIVYADADLAMGGLHALHETGVDVPESVAIVCFDDPDAGPLLDPPLTALARRDRQIGDLAASLVLRALEHPDAGAMEVRIPMELVIRRSCGCEPAPATDDALGGRGQYPIGGSGERRRTAASERAARPGGIA